MNIDTLRGLFPSGSFGADYKTFIFPSTINPTVLAISTDYTTWTLTSAGSTAAATNETDAAGKTNAVGVGTKVGATVSVSELSPDFITTTLTLAATPITLTDVAGTGQWGTVELYDFPAGSIMTLGAVTNAAITLTETWWKDDIAGTFGVGTAANTDASTIATTRQNIQTVTNIAALAAQTGPVTGQSTAVAFAGAAGGTDSKVYLNVKITDDAAHCPDLVTNGAFTGNATSWNLGAGWVYGTNSVDVTTASTSTYQTIANLTPGVSYSLVFTITRTAGSVIASVGGTAGASRSTSDTFTETIVAGSGGRLTFTGTGFSGTLDTVTLTPLAGTGTISGTVKLTWLNLGDF